MVQPKAFGTSAPSPYASSAVSMSCREANVGWPGVLVVRVGVRHLLGEEELDPTDGVDGVGDRAAHQWEVAVLGVLHAEDRRGGLRQPGGEVAWGHGEERLGLAGTTAVTSGASKVAPAAEELRVDGRPDAREPGDAVVGPGFASRLAREGAGLGGGDDARARAGGGQLAVVGPGGGGVVEGERARGVVVGVGPARRDGALEVVVRLAVTVVALDGDPEDAQTRGDRRARGEVGDGRDGQRRLA